MRSLLDAAERPAVTDGQAASDSPKARAPEPVRLQGPRGTGERRLASSGRTPSDTASSRPTSIGGTPPNAISPTPSRWTSVSARAREFIAAGLAEAAGLGMARAGLRLPRLRERL